MFAATDTAWAPWYVAQTDDKKQARLNIITHLLSEIPYEATKQGKIKLPDRIVGHDKEPPTTTRPPGHPNAVLSRQPSACQARRQGGRPAPRRMSNQHREAQQFVGAEPPHASRKLCIKASKSLSPWLGAELTSRPKTSI
jgi:hypothetical protein